MATIHKQPATFSVIVNGINVTDKFNPYAIKIVIEEGMFGTGDHAEVTLDDTKGQIELPPLNAPIRIGLGWQDTGPIHVFTGFVENLTSIGSRESGRLLVLGCISTDPLSAIKTTQNAHKDGGDLKEAANQFAKAAGLDVKIDPALNRTRDYWWIGGHSFKQWGEAMARQLGGTFKVAGDQATLTKRTSDTNADGDQLPTVAADVDETKGNVIRWSITVTNEETHKDNAAPTYDADKAENADVKADDKSSAGSGNQGDGALNNKFKQPDADQARDQANSNQMEQFIRVINGIIVIIGEPMAVSGGMVKLTGARPGIDGTYRILNCIHTYTRDGSTGYLTEMHLGNAGTGQGSPTPPDPGGYGLSGGTP